MAKEGAGRAGKTAKAREASGAGGETKAKGKKKKNPVAKAAKTQFMEGLRKQGVAEDQMKQQVRAHMKEVVKPAMSEAKSAAKAKNLKGPEKKKFIQDTLKTKLGLQA